MPRIPLPMSVTPAPPTWLAIITTPRRELAITVLMVLLIVATTILSVAFPVAAAWLFIGTALLGASWYRHTMRRYRAARRRGPDSDIES